MPNVTPYFPSGDDLLKLEFLINGVNNGLDSLLSEGKVRFEINKIPFAKFTFIASEEDFNSDSQSPLQSLNRTSNSEPIPIEVKISCQNEMKTLFKGVIKSLDMQHENNNVVAKIECKDVALSLLRSPEGENNDADTFEQKLTHFTQNLILSGDLTGQTWGSEHVTYNSSTSPWDYLVGFLDSIGLLVILKNSEFGAVDINNTQKTILYTAENGVNVFSFSGRIDPNIRKSSVTIQHWDVENQEVSTVSSSQEASENSHNISIGQTNYQEDTLQRIADAIIARSDLAYVNGSISTFGNLEAKIGDFMTFSKVNPEIDGKPFIINAEEHKIENGCWKTEFAFGLENERSFLQNTTSGINNSQAEIGHSNLINGLQIGIVTQIDSDPNNECRIKVRIPSLSENGEGIWARLATLRASKDFGSFFVPDVGDEVIVGCLGNNPDMPIILGGLYSSANPMPFQVDSDNYKSGFVTKEKSQIIFDDEKKSIEITTKNGNKITISDDAKGIVLQDENNNKITLNDSGITIESFKDLNLKAQGNIKIEGTQIAGNASGKMDLKGSIINLN